MNHFFLLLACFLSVEILFRSKYLSLIKSLINVSRKAIAIILNKNISDHWKEDIIPKYSLQMTGYSLQMLLTILLIIFIFVIADNFSNTFIDFMFSWNGIIESILFAFSFAYIRERIVK